MEGFCGNPETFRESDIPEHLDELVLVQVVDSGRAFRRDRGCRKDSEENIISTKHQMK